MKIGILKVVRRVVVFVLLGITPPAQSGIHADLDVPAGGMLEITAPAANDASLDSRWLEVFGYKLLLDDRTQFEKSDGSASRPYPIGEGQWLDLRARMVPEGVLVVERVRKIGRRPLFVRIQQQQSDTFAFPQARNPTAVPLKALIEDDSKGVSFRFNPAADVLLGGKIGQRVRVQDDRDLRLENGDGELAMRFESQLDVLWKLHENGSFLLLEPQAALDIRWRDRSDAEYTGRGRLSRGHALIALGDFVALHIGRQDFEDARQWIYDEVLDGVRVAAAVKRFEFEIGWSTGRRWADAQNETQDLTIVNLDLRLAIRKNHYIGAWWVARDDESAEKFTPSLIGLRWQNKPKAGLRHWVDIAVAGGHAGAEQIDGFGVDLGLNFIAKGSVRPYGVVALAYGSGVEQSKSQNAAFRQTGLQGNSDKFGGISRYNYYGEAFAPELSNRVIASIGAGVRPTANFSIDAMFHRYQQVELSEDLGETRLRAKPNGESVDLGVGIDVVFSARHRDLVVDLIVARFIPGDAFDRNETTRLAELEVEFKF